MTQYYLDSSVGIRILLGHSPDAARWFDSVNSSTTDQAMSYRILGTEMTRTLRRLGEPLELRHQVLDYVATVPLDHAVLQEAEAIIPHLKTLDAIHVASALRSGAEDLVICTHDRAMASVARQLGLDVEDPVTDDPAQA